MFGFTEIERYAHNRRLGVADAGRSGGRASKGLLGEAISYTLNQWQSLSLFLEDGDIPLDNKQVLGRVNWLFVGSDCGGQTAAVLYTLFATCKRLRINPFAYLRDVFTRLPETATDKSLEDLLPDRWIEGHPESRLVHRYKQAS